jgi:8-oxo-dGTP pyrophosphatase MutT (NUDIX family)
MIPRFDPEQASVIATGASLPAVPRERLLPDSLRARFASPPEWEPELRTETRFLDREPANASVLIGLVQRDELTVLLTRRTAHLRDHAGQVSFPGGRAERDDADVAATALREAYEEVGLPSRHVSVLGNLPLYTTVTQFVVTPVVALIEPGFVVRADPFEVDEVFEVPLTFVMDPSNHERRRIQVDGATREFFSMPWVATGPDGEPRRYFIWGATAAMLRNLYRFLSA